MKKQKQLQFFKSPLRFFGGRLLHGTRRSLRPLNSKEALHLVIRSSYAKRENSFLNKRNKAPIETILKQTAKKNFIKVYRSAIVGNHIHLIIQFPNRRNYKTFIRVLTSQIAEHVMRKQSFKVFKKLQQTQHPGDPPELQGKGQAFWQFRPFTRILAWGRDYQTACGYVLRNTLEALGFTEYEKRKNKKYEKYLNEEVSSSA